MGFHIATQHRMNCDSILNKVLLLIKLNNKKSRPICHRNNRLVYEQFFIQHQDCQDVIHDILYLICSQNEEIIKLGICF